MTKASTPKKRHPWRVHDYNTKADRIARGEQPYIERPALLPSHNRVGRQGKVGRIR